MKKTHLISLLLFYGFTFIAVGAPTAAANRMVKVVYFVPRDRPVQRNIPTKLDTQIKKVQRLYADQMEAHGHDRKTFNLENDASGKLIVYRIIGNFNDAYYHTDTLRKVSEEIDDQHDIEKHIYIAIVDISTEQIQGNCGIAYFDGGPVMVAATGDCTVGEFGITLIAHELGHALNLEHDFRDNAYIMSYGAERVRLSGCAASMLNVSPFFNQDGTVGNVSNTPATFQMLTPSTYPANATNWILRFNVDDADGVHQVQFLLSVPGEPTSLMSCKNFNNTRSTTVEFDMPTGATIAPDNNVYIRVVDQNGSVSGKSWTISATKTTETKTINTNSTETYLTLNYDSPDALVPINNPTEWAGWKEKLVWEKTPDGLVPRRPNGFMPPDPHIPFMDEWDYWFYAHAKSRIVYDLGSRNYTKFDAYFDMPNPCGSIASVEVIFLADGIEIYKSGVLRGAQARNLKISFNIPAGTKTLIIRVTDAGDGDGCDHFIFADTRLLHGESFVTETINTETARTETYLTLNYDSPDALVPTNNAREWGWDWGGWQATWEKTPNRQIPTIPHQGFMPAEFIPYTNQWDYWFYAHVPSFIVYDLSGGNYAKFDAYFDMPNPCESVASVEVIFLADNTEIYKSGVLKGNQARNTHISFDIPKNAQSLTIRVTDGGDGGACDHFIIANARLVHGEPPPRKVDPKIEGPKLGLSFSTTTTNVRVGDTFMLHLNSEKVTDLAGWQFGIVFDPAVLEALEVSEGDFLKREGGTTFFRQGRIDNAAGKITGLSSALISEKGVSGTGTLLSVTFSAKAVGETQVTLRDFEFGSINGKVIPVVPYEIVINVGDQPAWDVNQDGRISILDLILVARRLGETASANSDVDVNDDGIISILDLIIIAQHMGESTAAAPSTIAIDSIEGLNPAMLQTWIERAHIEDDGSITFQQGIASLQRLLDQLVPKKTTLLANYPNPFNPETWIPYQLAEPAEVSISIYTADGKLVRTLELGHQSVGIYESHSQAAHWDGRNEVGESIASGLYFFTFTAGKFVATRRMLIRK